MKYQALRPHFFSMVGWVVVWGWWGGVLGVGWVGWVMVWGWWGGWWCGGWWCGSGGGWVGFGVHGVLVKFPHLEKNYQFNEGPKIWTPKAFFPCGGGSNLILGTGSENQIFSKNFSHCQVFSLNYWKMTLLPKEEKSLPTKMDFCNLYMVSHTILWGEL